MRQRPVDVNQTTVFVDTQPRPVDRGYIARRSNDKGRGGGGGGADEMTEGRAWTLLAVALVMLLTGAYLVRGNHYAHLHRKIEEAYLGYLEVWDRDYRAAFTDTEWALLVEGHEQPLPLRRQSSPSKRVPIPPGSETTATFGDSQPSGPAQSQSATHGTRRRRRRRIAQSSLVEFRLDGLLQALFPARVPLLDQHRATHGRLWRPVVPELRHGRAMSLRVTDGRSGAVSVVDLGRVAFSRERSVAAGGEARCVYDQHGTWQADATCAVHEYLWGLCVKVLRDEASGAFSLDNATVGSGPGCGPEWGWEPGQWRRLDERRHRVNGRVYLPMSARNSTIVTVRHAYDPSILESDVVRRLTPNMEHQILFHAIGLALCFLGLVLVLSVGAFAAPALLRRGRATWAGLRGRRPRGRGAGGKDSDDEEL